MGQTLKEKIVDVIVERRIPHSLMPSFHARDDVWRENISYAEKLSSPSRTVTILYGAKEVSVMTQGLAKLRNATLKGISDTLVLFEDATNPHVLMP